MRYFKQCRDTYIRIFDDMGYITNQRTWRDKIYNETGRIFLSKISRNIQEIDVVVDDLFFIFNDLEKDELKSDFIDFLLELEKEFFIVSGDTLFALDEKEPKFSYKFKPKDLLTDIANLEDPSCGSTEDYFYEYHKKKPTLFGIQIELTSRCNERCIHCYIPNQKKDDAYELNYDVLVKMLEDAKQMNVVSVTLSGGEPFLYKDINRIIQKCYDLDFQINILSNLTHITETNLTILIQSNISQIQVSLYSMNPEEHDFITQKRGSHAKTIQSINKLIESNIPLVISTPVMKTNFEGYKDVLKWAEDQNIKTVTDFILMAQSDFNKSNLDFRISLDESGTLIQDILKYKKSYSSMVKEKYSNIVNKEHETWQDQPVCGVGMDILCLGANGDFYPCSGWQNFSVGNVYSQSIHDVWVNSVELNYLRKIKNSDFKECKACIGRDFCAMCLVRNYNESNGDLFKINKHYCDVAFLNMKLVEEYVVQSKNYL